MTSNDACFFYTKLFNLKIHESTGEAFEDLFCEVMMFTDDRFRKIPPWGNKGDGGNDGFIPDEKRYFQVYGPKYSSTAKNIVSYAKKKMEDDFMKILSNWEKPNSFHFVYNDKFAGAPRDLHEAIAKIKETHGLKEASVIDSFNLRKKFMALNNEQKSQIIGTPCPDVILDEVDTSDIGALLRSLSGKCNTFETLSTDPPTEFYEKIRINKLSLRVKKELTHYSRVGLVDDFLESDPGAKQRIAMELHAMYTKSKDAILEEDTEASDKRYDWMVEQLIPKAFCRQDRSQAYLARKLSIQVVFSEFFESCDIFESA